MWKENLQNKSIRNMFKSKKMMKCDKKNIVKEFFIKRFKKDPSSPVEKSYFSEWAERFDSGHPERYMDSQSLGIYKKLKKECR